MDYDHDQSGSIAVVLLIIWLFVWLVDSICVRWKKMFPSANESTVTAFGKDPMERIRTTRKINRPQFLAINMETSAEIAKEALAMNELGALSAGKEKDKDAERRSKPTAPPSPLAGSIQEADRDRFFSLLTLDDLVARRPDLVKAIMRHGRERGARQNR